MLFLRDFRGLTGGHLKHLDYLRHTQGISGVKPELYLSEASSRDSSNPFLSAGVPILAQVAAADGYFVGGMDWQTLDAAGIQLAGKPVVNLVQHVSHADPSDPKFEFLSRPALRICVSPEVESALRATGRVAGPVVTIDNGTDAAAFDTGTMPRERAEILVVGYKSPQIAHSVGRLLEDLPHVRVAGSFLDRAEFLRLLARARLCVLLPNPKEGFYLPALEAMAVGTPVIVPDCIGNRSFCIDGKSCVTPAFDAGAIAQAVRNLAANDPFLAALSVQGRIVAGRHTIERERDLYRAQLREYLRLPAI
jgi:hypothetical protein